MELSFIDSNHPALAKSLPSTFDMWSAPSSLSVAVSMVVLLLRCAAFSRAGRSDMRENVSHLQRISQELVDPLVDCCQGYIQVDSYEV